MRWEKRNVDIFFFLLKSSNNDNKWYMEKVFLKQDWGKGKEEEKTPASEFGGSELKDSKGCFIVINDGKAFPFPLILRWHSKSFCELICFLGCLRILFTIV